MRGRDLVSNAPIATDLSSERGDEEVTKVPGEEDRSEEDRSRDGNPEQSDGRTAKKVSGSGFSDRLVGETE